VATALDYAHPAHPSSSRRLSIRPEPGIEK
jgi:hypothetical protein